MKKSFSIKVNENTKRPEKRWKIQKCLFISSFVLSSSSHYPFSSLSFSNIVKKLFTAPNNKSKIKCFHPFTPSSRLQESAPSLRPHHYHSNYHSHHPIANRIKKCFIKWHSVENYFELKYVNRKLIQLDIRNTS